MISQGSKLCRGQQRPHVRGASVPLHVLLPDVTLIRCGGHFPGGTVLHWAKGAGGRGVLCSSDIATVTTDRKFLSFMRSYPNLIPLSAKQVIGIADALEPFQFDTVYGHYFDRVIPTGGKQILEISVKRYVAAINGAYNMSEPRGLPPNVMVRRYPLSC
jgi:hypothetical protein